MRILPVAAVSDPQQATADKTSVQSQLDLIRAWADANGHTVVEEIVIPGHSRYYDNLADLCAAVPAYARSSSARAARR